MKLLAKLVCASACILALSSQATTILYKSLDDIVKESDGIVQGTVKQVVAKKVDSGDIYTYVTVGNIDALKGQVDGTDLTLRLYGGEVDQEGLIVQGSPEFQENEQVIVFVEGNGEQIVPISGWGQGLFRIQQDSATNSAIVTDNAGNRILGIDNANLVKESRFSTAANIVGKLSVPAQSNVADTKGGVDDNGAVAPSAEAQTIAANAKQKAMAAGDFVAEIRKRVQSFKAAGRKLASVDPASVPAVINRSDSSSKANNDRVFSPIDNGKPTLPEGGFPGQDKNLR